MIRIFLAMISGAALCCLLSLPAHATDTEHINSRRSYIDEVIDDIFDGYKPIARPVNVPTTATVVNITVYLVSINRLEEKDQSMSQNIYLDVSWYDQHLVWNGSRYGGLDHVNVPQEKVWLPDIFITSLVGPLERLGFDQFPLRVESSGKVVWHPSGVFTTLCAIDITYYPLDKQLCNVHLELWTSRKDEAVLQVHGVSSVDYTRNTEWQLLSVVANENDYMNNGVFSRTSLTYTLRRRCTFILMTVAAPTILLAFMSPLVFALPALSGEKLSVCVTLFLTLVLSLSILLTELPHSSLRLSLHVTYLGMLATCSALAIPLTILVLNLHHRHRNNTDRPVHGSLWAGFAECVRLYKEKKIVNMLACLTNSRSKVDEETNFGLPFPDNEKDADFGDCRFAASLGGEMDRDSADLPKNGDSASNGVLRSKTIRSGNRPATKLNVKKREENRMREVTWECVAESLDFVLFRCFLCVVVIGTVIVTAMAAEQYIDDSEEL